MRLGTTKVTRTMHYKRALRKLKVRTICADPLGHTRYAKRRVTTRVKLDESNMRPVRRLVRQSLNPFSKRLMGSGGRCFTLTTNSRIRKVRPFTSIRGHVRHTVRLLTTAKRRTITTMSRKTTVGILLTKLAGRRVKAKGAELCGKTVGIVRKSRAKKFRILRYGLPPSSPGAQRVLRRNRWDEFCRTAVSAKKRSKVQTTKGGSSKRSREKANGAKVSGEDRPIVLSPILSRSLF